MTDVFKVQDEIANAIVQALQIKLAGGELESPERRHPEPRGVPAVPAGCECYATRTPSRRWTPQTNTCRTSDQTRPELWQGVERCWRGSSGVKTDNGFLAATEGNERGRQLAQHALQLSPDLAEAHAVLACVHHVWDWDWAAAETELQRALAIDPTNPGALQHRRSTLYDAWPLGRRGAAISGGAHP